MNRNACAALICLLPAGAMAQDATARLLGADGTDHGTAAFWAAPEGLVVRVEATGLPPGPHGLHIHETGRCTPDFGAAGDHFAPEGRDHGFMNPEGPHAGDLPLLHATADGTATADYYSRLTSLEALMDADGAALIVHEAGDSYRAEARSGGRLACGVIEAK
jgi:superoxide dismutase, Cu-Zn family